jgi:hypothetical protein
MSLTNSERQRKYRKKMTERDYALVRVWVPKDKVAEIKSLAEHLISLGLNSPPLAANASFKQAGPKEKFP